MQRQFVVMIEERDHYITDTVIDYIFELADLGRLDMARGQSSLLLVKLSRLSRLELDSSLSSQSQVPCHGG